jgi:hypothetical protein
MHGIAVGSDDRLVCAHLDVDERHLVARRVEQGQHVLARMKLGMRQRVAGVPARDGRCRGCLRQAAVGEAIERERRPRASPVGIEGHRDEAAVRIDRDRIRALEACDMLNDARLRQIRDVDHRERAAILQVAEALIRAVVVRALGERLDRDRIVMVRRHGDRDRRAGNRVAHRHLTCPQVARMTVQRDHAQHVLAFARAEQAIDIAEATMSASESTTSAPLKGSGASASRVATAGVVLNNRAAVKLTSTARLRYLAYFVGIILQR